MATTLPGYDPSQALYGYDINPAPQTGTGAYESTTSHGPYGSVLDEIPLPPNLYQQLNQIEDYTGQNNLINQNNNALMNGYVAPEDLAKLRQQSAQWGASSGMPLSQAVANRAMQDYYGSMQNAKQVGQTNARQQTQLNSSLMTPQNTALDWSSYNNSVRHSPDPTQAAQQQMADWMNKFLMTQLYSRNPGGGTGGRAGGGSGTDPGQQQMQQMLNGPNSTNWFYQPNNTAAGTPSYNPNRIPPSATDPNQQYDENGNPLFGYDPAQDPNSWDMFGQGGSTGGSGGYSSYEGTPGYGYNNGNWTNDTYNTPDASYYDPYGFAAYGDYGGGE